MNLSTRIRKIRLRHGMTLQQVADACGVTRSLLSKVENGHAAPSVATLTRIAAALGVPVSLLLETPAASPTAWSAADTAAWTPTGKGYRFQPLCAQRLEKLMQPLLFVARRGEVKPEPMRHAGEEFVYVLEGRMRYRIGNLTRELAPGDSVYFDAEEPHDLEPITQSVKYLAVFTEAPVVTQPAAGKRRASSKKKLTKKPA